MTPALLERMWKVAGSHHQPPSATICIGKRRRAETAGKFSGTMPTTIDRILDRFGEAESRATNCAHLIARQRELLDKGRDEGQDTSEIEAGLARLEDAQILHAAACRQLLAALGREIAER
jgi:hypothetical protein